MLQTAGRCFLFRQQIQAELSGVVSNCVPRLGGERDYSSKGSSWASSHMTQKKKKTCLTSLTMGVTTQHCKLTFRVLIGHNKLNPPLPLLYWLHMLTLWHPMLSLYGAWGEYFISYISPGWRVMFMSTQEITVSPAPLAFPQWRVSVSIYN